MLYITGDQIPINVQRADERRNHSGLRRPDRYMHLLLTNISIFFFGCGPVTGAGATCDKENYVHSI